MQFSDTSTKQGLLQDCEGRTNLGDGVITGDATLKAQFTRLINIRYARTLAKLQLLTGVAGAEDTNYTDQQFSYFDIVSGVNDYEFLTDGNGNTIADITGVLILPGATATQYVKVDAADLSDRDAMFFMSPNSNQTGIPSRFIERNSTVFFDVLPNFSLASGGKLFYRLVPSYFVAGDTTKKPGFIEFYHAVLSIGASYDWLSVHKAENTVLIQSARDDLAAMTKELEAYTRQTNPTRKRVTGAKTDAI